MPNPTDSMPYIVAITGGIGSGKSAAADQFARIGISVVDTDVISRELLMPGEMALELLTAHFGSDILNADGTLNRRIVRERVFSNALELQWLENLLHPLIQHEVIERMGMHASEAYIMLVVPLLTESSGYVKLVDRILVVDVPETLQKQRAAQRDNTSEEAIERIMQSQTNRHARLRLADDVLDNSGTLKQLSAKVKKFHEHYTRLAGKP